jgi:hypothetical protein
LDFSFSPSLFLVDREVHPQHRQFRHTRLSPRSHRGGDFIAGRIEAFEITSATSYFGSCEFSGITADLLSSSYATLEKRFFKQNSEEKTEK